MSKSNFFEEVEKHIEDKRNIKKNQQHLKEMGAVLTDRFRSFDGSFCSSGIFKLSKPSFYGEVFGKHEGAYLLLYIQWKDSDGILLNKYYPIAHFKMDITSGCIIGNFFDRSFVLNKSFSSTPLGMINLPVVYDRLLKYTGCHIRSYWSLEEVVNSKEDMVKLLASWIEE